MVRCESCESLHLIADNLGWFSDDGLNHGTTTNIETIMAEKGQHVLKFVSHEGMEFVGDEENK